jgi:hypothetical protein
MSLATERRCAKLRSDGLKDSDGIHLAVDDMKLGMVAQSAAQQLGLHSV